MNQNNKPNVGELRPTQIMFSFGVGAIVDLPGISAIVMGLDDWSMNPAHTREIEEQRLLQAVRWELKWQVEKLLSPPFQPEDSTTPNPFSEANRVGVPVATFPRWIHCPRCQLLAPLSSGLFKLKSDPYHPDRTRYIHTNCNKGNEPPVVPARFLVACPNGHLDDFPWVEFVHRGPTTCNAILRLIEYGPAGEARDLEVRCNACSTEAHLVSRRMSEAFGTAGKINMPTCRGRRPHLRDFDDEICDERVKTLLLGASNLWFPDVLTVLAIPSNAGRLDQLVDDHWATLKQSVNVQNVALIRSLGLLGDFYGYNDEELWQAITRKREREASGEGQVPDDLKTPEWNLLTHPQAHDNSGELHLRQVGAPAEFETLFENVVLVEKMREVRALVGFTRLEAPGDYDDPARVTNRRMRLSRGDPAWVPAAEVRGEGIFIQFSESALQDWLGGKRQRRRDSEFHASHSAWRDARYIPDPDANYPGLRYVLLHSFSHILMRQFALECGYSAASVRERIYSRNPGDDPHRPEPMAGVLIYTAAPDSEGTLGGLVSLGEPNELRRHLSAALRDAQLCASDPLCAEHSPSQRGITLHAAACHACLFAPETSCERGNRYLDRSVLVPTVERLDVALFISPD